MELTGTIVVFVFYAFIFLWSFYCGLLSVHTYTSSPVQLLLVCQVWALNESKWNDKNRTVELIAHKFKCTQMSYLVWILFQNLKI